MVIVKKLASAVIALGVGLALAVAGVSTPAMAASSPVTPLSVLPSQIVKGTAPTTGGALADASAVRMAQVYKFLTSPATVAALKSQAAGTATKTETDLIAAAARNVKIPAGIGTLAKGAGAAGVAYTGYSVGTMVGSNAAGAITTELWGVDANSLVCSAAAPGAGQGFLSFFSGQKCADFNAAAGLPLNNDVTGGVSSDPQCTTDGLNQCMRILGTFTFTVNTSGSSDWAKKPDGTYLRDTKAEGYCFMPTNSNGSRFPAAVYAGRDRNILDSSSSGPDGRFWPAPGCGPNNAGTGIGWPLGNQTRMPTLTGWRMPGVNVTQPAVAAPANPDRYISCDVTGTGSGYISTSGAMFTENDADWSKSVPACGALPVGSIPTNTKLTLHTVGGTDQTLSSIDTPAEVRESLDGKYKTCLQTVCQLILEKNGISCFDGVDCAGWFADSSTGTSTNTYTCKYAGQAVALSECTVYKPSWEPDTIASGQVLADPVTGTPAKNSPNAAEQAAGPVVGADAGAFGTPVQDPSKARECFPTGWGVLNPLNWVLQPAKCALEWAFVPRPDAMDDAFGKMSAGTARTALGGIGGLLAGFGSLAVTEGGCLGPPLTFNAFGISETSYPFSACAEPMAGVAATTKTLGAGVILLVSTMACTRYISGIIGFTAFGIASAGGDSDDVTVNMRTGEVKG